MSNAVVFMGSKAAGLLLCEAICELLKGRLAAILCPSDIADPRSVLASFHSLAERYSIPLQVVATRAETMRWLGHYDARVAFVHGWYQILPVDGLCEFYGFHYSPLPRYRGNAPLVWQIINGEKEIGVSFFRFSDGMDEGPLVAQAVAPLAEDESVGDALKKANGLMLELACRNIPALISGEIILRSQPDLEPSYCGIRTPADGRINWYQSAKKVHDFIRAQSHPYPGAFTYDAEGCLVRVWSSSVDQRRIYGVPGSVIDIRQSGVSVACGDGGVVLHSVSVEPAVVEKNASELIRSIKVRFV